MIFSKLKAERQKHKKWKAILSVFIVAVLILTLFLSGCACSHTWTDATCTEPKICSKCQATEGTANGHTFREATCSAPKTCMVCGYTEGEKLEHIFLDATCDEPSTCQNCGETRGSSLGHTTGFGICEKCGKKQTWKSPQASAIIENYTDGLNKLTDGLKDITTALSMHRDSYIVSYTYTAYEKFLYAKMYFDFALESCLDDAEFAEAKKECQAISNALAPLEKWETIGVDDCSKLNDVNKEIMPHVYALGNIISLWDSLIN